MAESESLAWADRPEPIPMPINLENAEGRKKRIELLIGNCAIALFRKRPELDYLAVLNQNKESEEDEWTFIFDKHALIYWMGNLALTREGQRSLHLANRNHGTFEDRYGWNPDIIIESWPSERELEAYIDYQTAQDTHEDLNNSLRQEFE